MTRPRTSLRQRILAAAAILPLLAMACGLDLLCICGGCARSDAFLGVMAEAKAPQSPCCRRAAAAASAQVKADALDGVASVSGADCCVGYDGATPAVHADASVDADVHWFVASSPTASIQVQSRTVALARVSVRAHLPRGPPPYLQTLRLRV